MPILKLRRHQANFSDEEILINPTDFPGLKLNDVVELKPAHEAESSGRILLQVRKWPEAITYPNSVSIKDTTVTSHLKLYADVQVTIVDKKEVVVDSVETCFSNAYLARSYMWGLRNHLNKRCIYKRQKLDYLNIRSQISEIWAQGSKVSSGCIDDDTKIVFRSASSLVYLFIQMSSEMWDYDINGDLYCEKAIYGFLTDLFERWRQNDCSHDITIILFSRTYYEAESLEEFPKEMRECLQVDYKNRFYEDCYRVAFQNDRFDLHDWNAKLTQLKSLFNQYQKEVIDRHQDKYDTKIPRAHNSSAAQGNFLEVLNMSLNVFEKHYFDRSFDRTGQLSVVVSPGVGVFEVDFEMTNLTKQRIIDNGIGSDLVCLGEQPLHTVPLLKFNSKTTHPEDSMASCDVYNMPHWINLSFYSSPNQEYYSNFIPRIKLPTIQTRGRQTPKAPPSSAASTKPSSPKNSNPSDLSVGDLLKVETQERSDENLYSNKISIPELTSLDCKDCQRSQPKHQALSFINHQAMPDLVDYDEYDSQVFKPNPMLSYSCQMGASGRNERFILSSLDVDNQLDNDDDFLDRDRRNESNAIQRRSSEVKNYRDFNRAHSNRLQLGETSGMINLQSTRISPQLQTPFTQMSLVDSYLADVKIKPESADDLSVHGYNIQSSRINRSAVRPKALINPFDPSHMTIKLTPNRRRWTHVFPQGPSGTFMQQHHYQPVQSHQRNSSAPYLANVSDLAVSESCPYDMRVSSQISGKSIANLPLPQASMMHSTGAIKPSVKLINQPSAHKSTLVSNETVRFAWCASGEQEWTPAITTGVDWKSLTMPACLPLTTDFFPSKSSMQNDYVIGEYTIDSSCIHSRYTILEVYRELVCQRLQKGFQIILLPRDNNCVDSTTRTQSKLSSHRSSRAQPTQISATKGRSTDLKATILEEEREEEPTEYTMSIGRIFHKLKLNGDTITVTTYRPRHPYPTIKIDYCYRFRAPFHETYGQSWVYFKSEKLENYSWNYLDNYICARGDSFELRNNLKFWRFRILIMPSRLNLRKISHGIRNSDQSQQHDIYHLEFSVEECTSLIESFVRLLEIINKTRRASTGRLSTSSFTSSSCPPTIDKSLAKMVSQRLNVILSSGSREQETNEARTETEQDDRLRFESINMDIDSSLRAPERAEWVHVQYHSYFDVNQAYELVIKWMVASGAGIAEMVQGWSRKVGNSSIHVVPIPWEPFAMPHTGKADPLRCPLVLELNLNALPLDGCSMNDNAVISFQEKILRRFGFVAFHDLISTDNLERQYVHLSGFAFVALPNLVSDSFEEELQKELKSHPLTDQTSMKCSSQIELDSSQPLQSGPGATKIRGGRLMSAARHKLESQDTISSPHEEYITRHITGARQNKASRLRGETGKIEFIWSWNYMLTKRWRSPSTQDESYAVSLMQDFKSFCMNGDDRLIRFWEEVRNRL